MNKLSKMVAIITLVVLISVSTIFAMGSSEKNGPKSYKIGVSKLLAHPALDAVEQGMQDYLKEAEIPVSYDFQNANGDISTAVSIAQQLKGNNCDVVVGIATPSAQSLANVFSNKPVVFSAVTDPVSAGLIASNICGVSDANPVKNQIELLVQLTGAKTVGNIYASGEANGVVLNEAAAAACKELGVEFVSASVANTSEVKMATQSIIDRVDAIYIATDNTVASAFASVSEVCAKNNKPVFDADPSSAEGNDFLVAWGFNYYKLGRKTGAVIKSVIEGKKPSDIGSIVLSDPNDFELWINLDVAKKLNIDVPQHILDMASVVIENGQKITK